MEAFGVGHKRFNYDGPLNSALPMFLQQFCVAMWSFERECYSYKDSFTLGRTIIAVSLQRRGTLGISIYMDLQSRVATVLQPRD